jgi:HPt (histidine-containing phosphotransfer) domain-containing protein
VTKSPDTHIAQLNVLRERYTRDLPDKARVVEEAVDALERRWDRDGLDALHHLAHRLAGSAAIYGFAAVSEAASSLELYVNAALESPTPPAPSDMLETLRERTTALVRAAVDEQLRSLRPSRKGPSPTAQSET